MSNMTCPVDGKELKLDIEMSRKEEFPVYSCDDCGRGYIIKCIIQQPIGWKTKRKISEKNKIDSIPF